ncbi:threonine/homoserine/homoserine lactone efflux protein [Gordonia hydrophobica]|nr:threonine/homoserine/homoserine lactone efflux protein [Gordonia hydrophobica]
MIRYVGAAYLVYLGVQQIRAKPHADAAVAAVPTAAWPMFTRGVWVNLLKPKAIVFLGVGLMVVFL